MSKSCKLCMWFHHPRWSRTRVFLDTALKFRFIIDDHSRKSQAESFQEWWSSIKYILLYCTCTFFKIKSCFHWENVVFLRDFRTGVATSCCHWALWNEQIQELLSYLQWIVTNYLGRHCWPPIQPTVDFSRFLSWYICNPLKDICCHLCRLLLWYNACHSPGKYM